MKKISHISSAKRLFALRNQAGKVINDPGITEDNFHTIFESAMDSFFLTDVNGYIVDCNQTAHLRLGYSKKEMVGKHISQFVSPRCADSISKQMGMSICDQSGRILFINNSLCQMLGYSKTEAEQLSIWEVTHPSEWEETEEYIHQLFDRKIKVYSGKKRFVTKDGDVLYTRIHSSVLKNPDGKLVNITQIENRTDFNKIKENHDKNNNLHNLLFETAKDTLWMDEKGFSL